MPSGRSGHRRTADLRGVAMNLISGINVTARLRVKKQPNTMIPRTHESQADVVSNMSVTSDDVSPIRKTAPRFMKPRCHRSNSFEASALAGAGPERNAKRTHLTPCRQVGEVTELDHQGNEQRRQHLGGRLKEGIEHHDIEASPVFRTW